MPSVKKVKHFAFSEVSLVKDKKGNFHMLKNLLSFLHEQFKFLYTLLSEKRKEILVLPKKNTYSLNNIAKILILFLFVCQNCNEPKMVFHSRTVG